jgi:hypothetical protein
MLVLGEAAKAFEMARNNPVIRNQWIPDEDWIRRIQANTKKACKIHDMKRGLSTTYQWNNE